MEERKEISLQPYTFFPDEEGENSKSNVITTTDGNLFSSNYFCCPRSRTFLLLEGYIIGLHGDVFPSWDSN